ncbi:uncharacterized protein LOC110838911 isoform X3 [Zootermopsis nevadensis]|uniref:uncharacterized protein LOC110838911 isoform X3 n=1 Tax=Zootermopsis nevadensis TaxID=136037 RepID=UPI000B8ED8B0|nr:uncharacterized protein LOC110838911 isoform X3 [Zootermopsis nevadensis]
MDVQEEFQRLYTQLGQLKEKNMRLGNRHLAAKITAMQEAAKKNYNDTMREEQTPSGNMAADHLKLNNVLAVVTDKIVCATVISDATNKTRSPPKSKCGSIVSSPDSETPLHEILSPSSLRIGVSSLSKSANDVGGPRSETNGRSLSEDSSASDRQLRGHKGKDSEGVGDAGFGQVDLEMSNEANIPAAAIVHVHELIKKKKERRTYDPLARDKLIVGRGLLLTSQFDLSTVNHGRRN